MNSLSQAAGISKHERDKIQFAVAAYYDYRTHVLTRHQYLGTICHSQAIVLRATARSAYRELPIVILSVRLSVCLSVLVSRPGTESSPGERLRVFTV